MAAPSPRQDLVAGTAVIVWILGMGLVFGVEPDPLQVAGGVLWVLGLLVAVAVAVQTYRTRSRHIE